MLQQISDFQRYAFVQEQNVLPNSSESCIKVQSFFYQRVKI